MRRSEISACVLVALGVATAQTSPPAEANCTVFTWNHEPVYLVTYPAQRISAAETCPSRSNESHACPIQVQADDAFSWDYNVSRILPDGFWNTDEGGQSFYQRLINASIPPADESSTGAAFMDYVIGSIATIQVLPPGASGYIQFNPYYQCYVGTFSNCTGNVSEPVGVEACAPVYHTTGTAPEDPFIFDGEFSIHNVSANNISQYTNPFAGESRGRAAGGVDVLRRVSHWLLLLSVAAVVMVIL